MQKPSTLLAATATLLLAPLTAPAAPLNPAELSADADWFLHVDTESVMNGPAGAMLRSKMTEKKAAKLRNFERIFGFHLLDDVNDITLWGSADIPNKGLLILDARFDRQVLIDLIRSAEGFKEYKNEGETIYTWIDERTGKTNWGAFYGNSQVLVSDSESYVIEGLAVLNGKRAAMTGLDLNSDLDTAWVLAYGDLDNLPRSPRSAAFDNAMEGYYELGAKGENLIGRLKLGMRDEASAINMEKMAIGLLAFANLSPSEKPAKAFIVEHIDVVRDGNNVAIYMDAPMDETMSLILNRGVK